MADRDDVFRRAIYTSAGTTAPVRPVTERQAAASIVRLGTKGRSALAARYAGITIKERSGKRALDDRFPGITAAQKKSYRSAQRSIQRSMAAPGKQSRPSRKLVQLKQEAIAETRERKAASADTARRLQMEEAAKRLQRISGFTMRGVNYKFSNKKRYGNEIQSYISTEDMGDIDFRDLLREGDEKGAFDALEQTLWGAYGLEGAYIDDLNSLEFF